MSDPLKATRPWGDWKVLYSDEKKGFKVKILTIKPNSAISLQYHQHRTETWTIVEGYGKVRVDDVIVNISRGDNIFVPAMTLHKVWNTTHIPLIITEVQIGNPCAENDITRIDEQETVVELFPQDQIVS
jgi:mannose-1-phosphate guanylyltransferase/mannose-6-phosphate isomerase